MSSTKFTPGPWAWFGNAGSNTVSLATTHSGRRYVMQFARWGMRGAQPRFQVDHVMVDASELLEFEVCHALGAKAAKADGACYRLDVSGIRHPDAHLIAAAPELYEALEGVLQYVIAWRYEYASKPQDKHNNAQRDLIEASIRSVEAALKKARGE